MKAVQRRGLFRRLSTLAAGAALLASCQSSPSSIFTPGDADSEQRAKDLSIKELLEHRPELLRGVDGVTPTRVFIDRDGRAHARLGQTVAGVPVFGAEAIVHLQPDGTFGSFTDSLVRGLQVNPTPILTAGAATDLAVNSSGGWSTVTGTPSADLQVLVHEKTAHLTYRVTIRQLEDASAAAMPVVFVDAHSGNIVMSYNALTDLANDDDSDGTNERETYDMNNGTNYGAATLADPSDVPAANAHTHIHTALQYFLSAHSRDSYDNAGATVKQYVHYSSNYNNAFWDGQRLTYGDGDGEVFGPLTTRDIVAHELAHGVTEHTADLVYRDESGALNEATSDIFAAAVEHYAGAGYTAIWWVGEDAWTPKVDGDSMRYMDNPALAGDYDFYFTRYVGTSDNGGVHWNSGIANLFFHLLSEGGTHPRSGDPGIPTHSVSGIGITNAAQLWYQALSGHMTTSTSFYGALDATLAAADDLGHLADWGPHIRDAWDAVGVFSFDGGEQLDSDSLSGRRRSTFRFSYPSAAGLQAVKVMTSGGSGDADVYVGVGYEPSTGSYDCRSISPTSEETCVVEGGGTVHVMVQAYSSINNVDYTVVGRGGTPCSPTVTCASEGAQCGSIVDDCGTTLDCGGCGGSDTCEANQCVACQPTTCADAGAQCGSIDDGCGTPLDCGGCDVGDTCEANQCVCNAPDPCDGNVCGSVTDACGVTQTCGCNGGDVCSSEGVCEPAPGPDCTIGSAEKGCACTANSDCAGNKCRGPSGGKTCK